MSIWYTAYMLPIPNLQQNVVLAPFTTYKIGGPADWFVEVRTADALAEAVLAARAAEVPYFILGTGANILVGDKGIRGLVIRNCADHAAFDGTDVTAESGLTVERLIDGLWMVLFFIITAMFLSLPGYMVDFVRFLTALLVAGAILLGYVIVHKQHAHSVASGSRWAATLRHLVDGLHTMGRWRPFSRTVLISLLYLVLQVVTVFALMRAYGLDLSFWAGAAVLTCSPESVRAGDLK